MKATVAIKGTKAGLVVTLDDAAPLEPVVEELTARLKQGAAFFRDARITLNAGGRGLTAGEWQGLRDLLVANGVDLHDVVSASETGRQAARAIGLTAAPPAAPRAPQADARQPAAPQAARDAARDAAKDEPNGLMIRKTMRSGVSVRHPGHVVLLGDLHAGAEIIAGGDIVVWGALRGIAHAGALGDESAGIYALYLSPTQLRIAGIVARAPERQGQDERPESARVEEGKILVEPWERTK